MSGIAVRELTLTLPRAVSPHGARAHAEDALRCAGDDPRLLLVRRLALGVVSSRGGRTLQSDWASRTETMVRAAALAAVHATTPGAELRDVVYFADALEARALLIRLLARGRWPTGWFWRLAVPEWNGAPWSDAARRLLPDLVARPGGTVALARTVRQLVAAGELTPLLAPLTPAGVAALLPELVESIAALVGTATVADAQELSASPSVAAALTAATTIDAVAISGSAPAAVGGIHAIQSEAVALARRLLAALAPAEITALWRELVKREANDPVAVWLAAQIVLESAPPLAATPRLAIAVAEALRSAVVASWPVDTTSSRRQAPPSRIISPPHAEPVAPRHRAAVPEPLHPDSQHDVEPAPAARLERRSEAAGLLLLPRPLIMLGLPQWLDDHPREALGGFAWELLAAVASRMRVPADDPVWRVLPEAEAQADAGLLTAWRIGLDRWLRRCTRIGLAALVRRPGWLILQEGATLVRFRLADADIRLRRHAIDVDPGWVPWLGHAIRFAYDDHPIIGSRP